MPTLIINLHLQASSQELFYFSKIPTTTLISYTTADILINVNMKSQLLASALLLATPILGCLHFAGELQWQDEEYRGVKAGVNDNGRQVCDTAWGAWWIDHDGHPSIPCLPGYFYTTNGETSWYGNNAGSTWTLDNHATNWREIIYDWDQTVFC